MPKRTSGWTLVQLQALWTAPKLAAMVTSEVTSATANTEAYSRAHATEATMWRPSPVKQLGSAPNGGPGSHAAVSASIFLHAQRRVPHEARGACQLLTVRCVRVAQGAGTGRGPSRSTTFGLIHQLQN